MRVAAIYDIHGNLPALEAVLREISHADVDRVVIGGDVIPGPMPHESLTCLLNLDLPTSFIQGNGEYEVLAQMAGRETGNVPETFRDVIRWTGEQLDPQLERAVTKWPGSVTMPVDGIGNVLFCHATPRNNTDVFTRLTPEEQLAPVFADVDAPLVVCGHTHMQFDRPVGNARVVNAGSVGMPFGEVGAYWLLLGPDVELRFTMYHLDDAAERIRATSYPQADEFASRNVLHTPSAEEMLEIFAKAELK